MLVDVSRIAGSTVRSSIIAHTVITYDDIPLLQITFNKSNFYIAILSFY